MSLPESAPAPYRSKMSGAVTAAMVLLWVEFGGGLLVLSIYVWGALTFIGSAAAETDTPISTALFDDTVFAVMILVPPVVAMALLAFCGVLAVHISRGRRWTRGAGIVAQGSLLGLMAVIWISLLVVGGAFPLYLLFNPVQILGVGTCVAIIVLLTRPSVRAWCVE